MNNFKDLFRIKTKSFYTYVKTSLWFIPGCILIFFTFLSYALIEVDIAYPDRFKYLLFYEVGQEGSMNVLTTIANSMITIAGVVFSITVVALSLSSTQYSSRVLRNFMGDKKNQISLGIFVGIFIYCLLIMLQINLEETKFLPSLSIFVGIFFAFIGIGDFVFFIHHIATSIQASHILSNIYEETVKVMKNLYPNDLHEDEEKESKEREDIIEKTNFYPIPCLNTGYIQKVDEKSLLNFADRQNILIKMELTVGSFVIKGQPLVSIDKERSELTKKINKLFILGINRTIEQDAEFGIRQTVDVAVKALSPGINDTTTAVMCIDRLAAMLSKIINKKMRTYLYKKNNKVRLIGEGNNFDYFADEAFNQIRHNSRGDTLVLMKLAVTFKYLYDRAENLERKKIIAHHINLLRETINNQVKAESDKILLRKKCDLLKESN